MLRPAVGFIRPGTAPARADRAWALGPARHPGVPHHGSHPSTLRPRRREPGGGATAQGKRHGLDDPAADAVRLGRVDVATIRGHETVRAPFASVARVALTEPGHHRRTYALAGPEPATARQQVEAIAAALGRPVGVLRRNQPSAGPRTDGRGLRGRCRGRGARRHGRRCERRAADGARHGFRSHRNAGPPGAVARGMRPPEDSCRVTHAVPKVIGAVPGVGDRT